MNEKIIDLSVKDEYVFGDRVIIGACGSHDDVVLSISFNETWDGLSKKIIWQNSRGETTFTLLDDNNPSAVLIPLTAKRFEGETQMSIKGFTVEDGKETSAVVSATASFTVLPAISDDGAEEAQEPDATTAEQLQAEIDKKVSRRDGYGLSQENYTQSEKEKVNNLPYDTIAEIDELCDKVDNKYDKPIAGIPASDLAEKVVESLDKADTALQEHQDLTAYSLISETGNKIEIYCDNETYKVKVKLFDKNNNLLSESSGIDLPIEQLVMSVAFDNATKELVITLKNGNITRIPLSDIISGLATENWVKEQGYLTQHQPLDDYATKEYVDEHGGKIDKINVNGTEQEIIDKTVEISMPTKTSDLDNDSNFVTDDELEGKMDITIGYEDEIDTYPEKRGSVQVYYIEQQRKPTQEEIELGVVQIGFHGYYLYCYKDLSTQYGASISQLKIDNNALYRRRYISVPQSPYWTEWESVAWNTDIAGKVDKVKGKGLSSNDYTTAEKNKLADIEVGAEVNKVNDVKVNDISVVTDGVANIKTGYEFIEKIILGYTKLQTEPEDWETNYRSYYRNTGTLRDPTYTALTNAVPFEPEKYYSFDETLINTLEVSKEPDGNNYDFKNFMIFAKVKSRYATGTQHFFVDFFNTGSHYLRTQFAGIGQSFVDKWVVFYNEKGFGYAVGSIPGYLSFLRDRNMNEKIYKIRAEGLSGIAGGGEIYIYAIRN